jgi:hypothetical protein
VSKAKPFEQINVKNPSLTIKLAVLDGNPGDDRIVLLELDLAQHGAWL